MSEKNQILENLLNKKFSAITNHIDQKFIEIGDNFHKKFEKINEKFTKLENDLDEKFTKIDEKFTKLDKDLDEKFTNIDDRLTITEKSLNCLRLNQDWQFEITTRHVVYLQEGYSFSRLTKIEKLEDLVKYMSNICKIKQLKKLITKDNIQIVLSEVLKNNSNHKELSNQDFWKSLQAIVNEYNKNVSEKCKIKKCNFYNLEVNISGQIVEQSPNTILIQVGEVKQTISKKSKAEAEVQVTRVLLVLRHIIGAIIQEDFKKFSYFSYALTGVIYYGRLDKTERKFSNYRNEAGISYIYVQVTGEEKQID